ncbi:alpha/beta fold hydrolase [Streptomyces sp. NPDC021093]|uniref:alpha/beta fold hydrolase n=1 Tax=Streptomyces sp. NPDC021093 TaxID=3365112 RepID=UPI0037926AB9
MSATPSPSPSPSSSSSPAPSPAASAGAFTFSAPDGTRLAYRITGPGKGAGTDVEDSPVLCLPGGPMQDPRYLGDLGGLDRHRRLLFLDLRGTGRSEIPADPSSYRCDRLVDDIEALRAHLGLDRIDLLAHCAGVNLAVLYLARYPERVGRLALITPSTAAVGIPITAGTRLALAQLRKDEPWFPEAYAALESLNSGAPKPGDVEAIAPFFWGRWDAAAQEQHAAASAPANPEAVRLYGSEGAYDPEATRAALAERAAPVFLLAGEVDLNSPPQSTVEFAALFPDATVVVQPGAGHSPWVDDPEAFVTATARFLG